jgi:hypothetical protein
MFVEPLTKLQSQVAQLTGPPAGENDKRTPEQRRDELRNRIEDYLSVAKFLEETPFGFDHSHDRMTLTFGLGNAEPLMFTTQNNKKLRNDIEVQKWAESLNVPFRKDLKTEKLIEHFKTNRGLPKPR